MRFPGRLYGLCVVVWILGIHGNPIDPTITAPPSLDHAKRAEPSLGSDFWGYTSENGSFIALSCDSGYTLTTSTPFADCVSPSATNPDMGTGCRAGSTLLLQSSTSICSGSLSICATYLLYRHLADSAPFSIYGCNTRALNMELYLTTTTGTSVETQAAPSKSSSAAAATSTGSSPGPASSQNLAWVAGPVVGGVVALVLAGVLVWWLRRRKQRAVKGAGAVVETSEVNGKGPATSELDGKPTKGVSELGGQGVGEPTVQELSGVQEYVVPELDSGPQPTELPAEEVRR